MKPCKKVRQLFLLFSVLLTLTACELLFPPSPYTCDTLPASLQNVEENDASIFILWSNENLLASHEALFRSVSGLSDKPTKIWLRDDSIENFTLSDQKRKHGAVISALVSIDETNPDTLIAFQKSLSAYSTHTAIYAVKKSVPLSYQKTWLDGEQSPALISMSFFQKPEGMKKTAFREYWFCSHTPFALDIHPLWHYERNAVEQVLTAGSPHYDGIVPLSVKHDEDIQFSKFFAADGKNPLFNALRIQSDVQNFINLDLIETVAMREYVLRASKPHEIDKSE